MLIVLFEKAVDCGCRSATDRKTPRLSLRFVRVAKKPSTALSQEADVGVKWNVHADDV